MTTTRTLRLAAVATAALVAVAPAATASAHPGSPARPSAGPVLPATIELPDGFQPEGITFGRGTQLYVGSLADGDVFRADAVTGEGSVLVDVEGRIAVGIDYDRRTDALVVAGGPTGQLYVYDATTGEERAVLLLAQGGFPNDVAITRDAYWVTDSARGVLYRVALDRRGRVSADSDVQELPLGEDFQLQPGQFGANGIVALPGGRYLVVVNSTTGGLYRVDTRTGEVQRVDTGGEAFVNGDGLELRGDTLYVVQNFRNQVSVVDLDRRATSGELVGVIRSEAFRIPTTAALLGPFLYVVNARFGVADPASADFEVVRVPARP